MRKQITYTLVALVSLAAPAAAKEGLNLTSTSKYYKVHPQFHPYPEEKMAVQSIDRFGPVGIGIFLIQPAFKMQVKNIEPGSTPISPPSGPTQWLFQGPPAESKLLAVSA